MKTTKCPYCGEDLNEQEAEQVCDCGCPSCRRMFDLEDYEDEICNPYSDIDTFL